jgi:hypothetical protein
LRFFSINAKCILDSKRILLGLGHRSSCREAFKKLDILTIPSMYIYAMVMFVVGNPDIYQTNYVLHGINMRQKNKLHILSVKLSAIQKGVLYSSIKVFNALPSNIVDLQNNTSRFQNDLRRYLAMNVFYSVDEFWSTLSIVNK